VAQHLGDGALVYFGYPQAREDDTERAVLAALELVQAIAALPTKEKLTGRIGIATGVVVVGDLSEAEGVVEHGALGETPNLAARVQAFAKPGAVVISAHTRRIAGALFRYRDLGEITVAGFDERVRAWEVLGTAAATSRSQVLESAEMLPLIGRDEEIDLLTRGWERAKGGDGRIVLLSGEAGIGKSRIALGLLEHLADERRTVLRLYCSPYRQQRVLSAHRCVGAGTPASRARTRRSRNAQSLRMRWGTTPSQTMTSHLLPSSCQFRRTRRSRCRRSKSAII
jgi:hypothetical protein